MLLAITLERVLALYHPFGARAWATSRNAWLTLAGTLAISAAIGAVAFVVYDLRPNAYFRSGFGCFTVVDDLSSIAVFVTFNLLFNMILPTLLLLVLTFILRAKIYYVSRLHLKLAPYRSMSLVVPVNPTAPSPAASCRRGDLSPFPRSNSNANRSFGPSRNRCQSQGQQRSKCRRSDLRIASSVFVLSLVEVMFYLPFAVVWMAYNVLDYVKKANELRHFLGTLGRLLSTLMIVIHLWNLYIYFATVSIFRREFVRLFCRGCGGRDWRARVEESMESRAAALQIAQFGSAHYSQSLPPPPPPPAVDKMNRSIIYQCDESKNGRCLLLTV